MTDSEKSLVHGPEDLPRAIPPPRDLWPGIARAIAALPQDAARDPAAARHPEAGVGPGAASGIVVGGAASRVAAGARPGASRAAWSAGIGLAATVACLALGIWIGRSMAPAGGVGPPSATLLADLAPDERFARARQALLVEAGLGLSRLSPQERGQVEASLATLREAIADIRHALGEDPGNLLLHELLVNTYQDEIRVLTAVTQAGGTGQET